MVVAVQARYTYIRLLWSLVGVGLLWIRIGLLRGLVRVGLLRIGIGWLRNRSRVGYGTFNASMAFFFQTIEQRETLPLCSYMALAGVYQRTLCFLHVHWRSFQEKNNIYIYIYHEKSRKKSFCPHNRN